MSEDKFQALVAEAGRQGITVVLHDDPACRFMVAPHRSEVVLYRGLPIDSRIRMLARTLKQLTRSPGSGDKSTVDEEGPATRNLRPVASSGQNAAFSDTQETVADTELDRPTIVSMPKVSRPLAESLLEDITLEEGAARTFDVNAALVARQSAELDESGDTVGVRLPGPVDAHVCDICGEVRYGEVAGLRVCRHHLGRLIEHSLQPEEVARVRELIPGHPEVDGGQYD